MRIWTVRFTFFPILIDNKGPTLSGSIAAFSISKSAFCVCADKVAAAAIKSSGAAAGVLCVLPLRIFDTNFFS